MTATDHTRKVFAERQEALLEFYDLPARSRYLDIERPQMRVHLLEAGEGEPLVLIHGGDGEGALWAPLMTELEDDFRLYALDRPGCGLSDPFDYRVLAPGLGQAAVPVPGNAEASRAAHHAHAGIASGRGRHRLQCGVLGRIVHHDHTR